MASQWEAVTGINRAMNTLLRGRSIDLHLRLTLSSPVNVGAWEPVGMWSPTCLDALYRAADADRGRQLVVATYNSGAEDPIAALATLLEEATLYSSWPHSHEAALSAYNHAMIRQTGLWRTSFGHHPTREQQAFAARLTALAELSGTHHPPVLVLVLPAVTATPLGYDDDVVRQLEEAIGVALATSTAAFGIVQVTNARQPALRAAPLGGGSQEMIEVEPRLLPPEQAADDLLTQLTAAGFPLSDPRLTRTIVDSAVSAVDATVWAFERSGATALSRGLHARQQRLASVAHPSEADLALTAVDLSFPLSHVLAPPPRVAPASAPPLHATTAVAAKRDKIADYIRFWKLVNLDATLRPATGGFTDSAPWEHVMALRGGEDPSDVGEPFSTAITALRHQLPAPSVALIDAALWEFRAGMAAVGRIACGGRQDRELPYATVDRLITVLERAAEDIGNFQGLDASPMLAWLSECRTASGGLVGAPGTARPLPPPPPPVARSGSENQWLAHAEFHALMAQNSLTYWNGASWNSADAVTTESSYQTCSERRLMLLDVFRRRVEQAGCEPQFADVLWNRKGNTDVAAALRRNAAVSDTDLSRVVG